MYNQPKAQPATRAQLKWFDFIVFYLNSALWDIIWNSAWYFRRLQLLLLVLDQLCLLFCCLNLCFSFAPVFAKVSLKGKIEPSKHFYHLWLTLGVPKDMISFSRRGDDEPKKIKKCRRFQPPVDWFESRMKLREMFSLETCEIKSLSLPSRCPQESSAEKIRST